MKKTHKYFLLGLTIYFSHFISFGQQSKIDSLCSLIKKEKADTNKVNHLNNLLREYYFIGSYDTALYYGNAALELAQSIKFFKGVSSSYNNIGIVYDDQGNYSKAMDYYFKSLKLDEQLNDKRGMAKQFGSIGGVYWGQGDYRKALDYYFKALEIGEELGDKKGVATRLANIGNVYYEQASANTTSLSTESDSLYKKALDYYFKALKIAEELGDKNRYAILIGNIGNVYYGQSQQGVTNAAKLSSKKDSLCKEALSYDSKALSIFEDLGDKNKTATVLGNIGLIYIAQKKYTEAYNYLYRAIALSESIGAMDHVKDQFEMLSTLYEKATIPLRDTIAGSFLTLEQMRLRSMYYYKRSIGVRDTIFSEESKKQLVRKEMNYEFDKKETAAKAEQDKKDTIAAAEKRRQKIITYSVSGGLFLVLLLALFIFRGYRQKQKANKELAEKNSVIKEQKKLVEEKNKDITDSINYAKRIQEAFLIPESEIKKQFADAFVFFKPKDIVSGDIYWFAESKYNKVLVVADCTGHGVPGGFMSMLSFAMLQETLLLEEVKTTAQALTYLDHKITETLNRNNRSYRDGMDMTLCAFSKSSNTLQFSCANRPLILIRNGELKEFSPDKFTIGGAIDNVFKDFRNQEIQIELGDMIYLFTDGYVDQFGGPKGKKFKHKQLNEKLLAISHQPLAKQKEILEQSFNDWKGTLEQVDDVCVIGIRI